jgi:hypothetical protein
MSWLVLSQEKLSFRSLLDFLTGSLGKGFESDVADELKSIASCYAQLAEQQKSFVYERRAQDIRKTMQKHL